MADDLTPHFSEFFRDLWGWAPFAWQQALADRVLRNDEAPWPQAIALPTAAGKTACIDVAVFALAAQADRQGTDRRITAPRRIFFVVDRRVIVDEAFARARSLAARLTSPPTPLLTEVAARLKALARGPNADWPNNDAVPLSVFELRGGMYRSEAWAQNPLQPTVVASTVDQFGSRLLFRAYGRGPGMWPVYAGLTGNDSLILLDEAHCARPFLQTLHAVARYRTWAKEPLGAPFCPVVMSATPPPELAADIFRDVSAQPRDAAHPLGQRQLARKPARLVESKASGKKASASLAKDLAGYAIELATGPRKAVVVFANRVATARATYRELTQFCAKHGGNAVLLTGRMRALDKDLIVAESLRDLTSSAASDRSLSAPVLVVATQTLEVGADLDFDALVTECASLDALRQRFGRLNRTGRQIEGIDAAGCPVGAAAVVVVRADQTTPDAEDPVYGCAIGGTWQELLALRDEDGCVDFGVAHLNLDTLPRNPSNTIIAPAPAAPIMLPSHIDAWVQTSPEPLPAPQVGFFLHGQERAAADVRVCWRSDIGLGSETEVQAAIDTLILCPPAAAETLPVPIGVMRRWLAGEDDDDTADIEGAEEDYPSGLDGEARSMRRALPWIGRQETRGVLSDSRAMSPGDVIVIPSSVGGQDALGDLPQRADHRPARLDLGDEAFLKSRAKAALRLHPAVIAEWPLEQAALKDRWIEFARAARARLDDDADQLVDELKGLLTETAATLVVAGPHWLRDAVEHFSGVDARRLRALIQPHPSQGLVLLGRKPLPSYTGEADQFTDEDDASASGTLSVPLLPAEGDGAGNGHPIGHLSGVAYYARRFAEGCGLPRALIEALQTAGLLHDIGKADPRFQALLRGGNPWAVEGLLAKSGQLPRDRLAYEQARAAAGYPPGGRHELLSVRLAESDGSNLLPPPDDPLHGLVLHLIASHHGRCRPFAPVIDDVADLEVGVTLHGITLSHKGPTRLERLDSGIATRFWQQVRRYGWWGSAWLEALLRLGDHRRSEYEQLHGGRQP